MRNRFTFPLPHVLLLPICFVVLINSKQESHSADRSSHECQRNGDKLCHFIEEQLEKAHWQPGEQNHPSRNATEDQLAVNEVIRLVSARLDLAQPVALYKWQHNQSIDDPIREASLLASVATQANASGLSVDFALTFFQDQINASKVIQFALFSIWQRNGAPNVTAPDLTTVIRPLINNVTSELVHGLVAIQGIRAERKCPKVLRKGLNQLIRDQQITTSPEANRAEALCVALAHVCAGCQE